MAGCTKGVTLAHCLRKDKVSALRLRDVCRVAPGDSIEDVVRTMIGCRAGFALVMGSAANASNNDGNTAPGASPGALVGIFTERDFVNRVVAAGVDPSRPVETVMSPAPKTVRRSASVQSAVELMASGGYRHLPVTGDGGEPLGVLSVKDVVRYLVEYFPAKVYNLPPTPDQAQPAREGA
jgi:CBS domain-containing protein